MFNFFTRLTAIPIPPHESKPEKRPFTVDELLDRQALSDRIAALEMERTFYLRELETFKRVLPYQIAVTFLASVGVVTAFAVCLFSHRG